MQDKGQGIERDQRGEEQPTDKQRAQAVHTTEPTGSPSREATRDPKLDNLNKRSGSEKAG